VQTFLLAAFWQINPFGKFIFKKNAKLSIISPDFTGSYRRCFDRFGFVAKIRR
jgi:hypothetical protein